MLFPFFSCHVVLRSFATLGYGPVNVLVRRLDIACLAVNTAAANISTRTVLAKYGQGTRVALGTYFWALIWNLTPSGFESSSTYS